MKRLFLLLVNTAGHLYFAKQSLSDVLAVGCRINPVE